MKKPERSKKGGYVLVPAEKLAEIRALEGALRHERGVLRAHCLLSLNEGEVSGTISLYVNDFPHKSSIEECDLSQIFSNPPRVT